MALPPLATTADLLARGVTIDEPLGTTMLNVASSLVREACGSPVLQTTSTIALWADGPQDAWDLPGQPVTAVTAVAVNGVDLLTGGWRVRDGRLHLTRELYYPAYGLDHALTVTLTHGFPTVPDYIKQLVCDLAILGAKTAAEGAQDPRVVIEQIDDYKVTFVDNAKGALVSSAMELPPATRRALRTRFGGGVDLVSIG